MLLHRATRVSEDDQDPGDEGKAQYVQGVALDSIDFVKKDEVHREAGGAWGQTNGTLVTTEEVKRTEFISDESGVVYITKMVSESLVGAFTYRVKEVGQLG